MSAQLPLLLCFVPIPRPQGSVPEFHCEDHDYLRKCFFLDLSRFSAEQLEAQQAELDRLLDVVQKGQKWAQRRRTIRKQAERVGAALAALRSGGAGGSAASGFGSAEVAVGSPEPLRTVVVTVAGDFPADKAAAKLAWPVRVWPLSARPWAFIRDVSDGQSADLPLHFEVWLQPLRASCACSLCSSPGGR